MELYAGLWALLPAIVAILLAAITKEIYSSLIVGVMSGTIIYALLSGQGFLSFIPTFFNILIKNLAENASLIIFVFLLGGMVALIYRSGGHRACDRWLVGALGNRRNVSLTGVAMGCLIFIDDYFNCLMIGSVMRSVSDKFRISRAKLAYILDSTAAPVCIMVPLSSWAMAIINTISASGVDNGVAVYLASIPYNLYAIAALVMVLYIAITRRDFGAMERYEALAEAGDDQSLAQTSMGPLVCSERGTIWDFAIPNLAIVVLAIAAAVAMGCGMGAGKVAAVDVTLAINIGCAGAILVALLMYVPRKLITFGDFWGTMVEGFQTMVPAVTVLVLAWGIATVSNDYLNAGDTIMVAVQHFSGAASLLPFIIFVICAAASMTLGSWGAFAMCIPLVTIIAQQTSPSSLSIYIAACLAGSVFGDHCSPITDTTLLSSASAGCIHMTHVRTQLPYALVCFVAAAVGFVVAGYISNPIICIVISLAVLATLLTAINLLKSKGEKNVTTDT